MDYRVFARSLLNLLVYDTALDVMALDQAMIRTVANTGFSFVSLNVWGFDIFSELESS